MHCQLSIFLWSKCKGFQYDGNGTTLKKIKMQSLKKHASITLLPQLIASNSYLILLNLRAPFNRKLSP